MKKAVSIGVLMSIAVAYCWVRTYGEDGGGYCLIVSSDGNYVVSGWIAGLPPDSSSMSLMKTDTSGEPLWIGRYYFTLGGIGNCVTQTTDGGYMMVGATCAYDGAGDLIMIKTDDKGDTLWTKVYGSWWEDNAYWVEQTKDGGYIVTGTSRATGSDLLLWLLKTDNKGDTLWSKLYSFCSHGYCVRQTTDGGYIIASPLGLIKTNSNGDTIWTFELIGWDASCVETTGGYVFTTTTWGSFGRRDVFLYKVSEGGDSIWAQCWGGDDEDYSYDVQQTSDGGYAVVGETYSFAKVGNRDIWFLKTDGGGDTLWTRVLPGIRGRSLKQTSDGGYIIAGTGDGINLTLIKTDSLGYAEVEEPPVSVTHLPDWEVVNPIGREVVLRYHDKQDGFHGIIYDISGKKVDELSSASQSGTITWGEGYGPGVYFIRSYSDTSPATLKIVLLK